MGRVETRPLALGRTAAQRAARLLLTVRWGRIDRPSSDHARGGPGTLRREARVALPLLQAVDLEHDLLPLHALQGGAARAEELLELRGRLLTILDLTFRCYSIFTT